MSRLPTILLGSVLFGGVAWIAATVTKVPFELAINGAIAELLGHRVAPTNYAEAIFTVLCLVAAIGIGLGVGWSLRGVNARTREADLQRRLNDTKARLPRLESGMRNKEMHVSRVEQQMKDLESLLPPLHKQVEERDIALRDRERTITTLRSELALLKGTPLAPDALPASMATLDLDDDPLAGSANVRDEDTARIRALETRVAELQQTQSEDAQRIGELNEKLRADELHAAELSEAIRSRDARIAELVQQGGPRIGRMAELEASLDVQRKRSDELDRERQRQDKWLDVLNDQLERARETNDRLTRELADRASLQARVAELEANVKRLEEELGDRERRLAASRFEMSTARSTIAHLQAQLEGKTPTTITH